MKSPFMIKRMGNCMVECDLSKIDKKQMVWAESQYALAKDELMKKDFKACLKRVVHVLEKTPTGDKFRPLYGQCVRGLLSSHSGAAASRSGAAASRSHAAVVASATSRAPIALKFTVETPFLKR